MYSKRGILHYLVISMVGLFSLQSCMYENLLMYVNANDTLVCEDDGIIITYPNVEYIKEGIKRINNKETRFFLLANVKDNLLDEDLESSILSQSIVDELLMYAYSYLGTPYRYGGITKRGIDCSAFVRSVYKEVTDIKLPRTSARQAIEGEKISKSDLRRGDLVFFANSARGRISHVGIVEDILESGEIRFIHAASSRGVMVSSLKDSYWGRRFRYAKRIVS